MKRLSRTPGITLIILALSVSAQPRPQAPTNQEILSRARGAYYSLTKKEFKGFTAAVEPNWEVILGDTATPASLKIFRAVQFSMTVDASGAATITHEVGPDAAKPELQPTVNRIHADVQRLVAGFFNTWRIFVVNSPFPETDIQIENRNARYELSYTTQTGHLTIAMTDNLVITEWTMSNSTVKRTVKPRFQKTPDGLLLSGYEGVFNPVGDGIKTTLEFQIEYQDAGGIKLPYKVRLSGMHGNEPVEAELVFRVKS